MVPCGSAARRRGHRRGDDRRAQGCASHKPCTKNERRETSRRSAPRNGGAKGDRPKDISGDTRPWRRHHEGQPDKKRGPACLLDDVYARVSQESRRTIEAATRDALGGGRAEPTRELQRRERERVGWSGGQVGSYSRDSPR